MHYFSPTDSCMRVFDVEQEKWKIYTKKDGLPRFGASIYDPKSKRFYLVGGIEEGRYGQKSNSIIWFSLKDGWGEAKMEKGRSSAMVTMIESDDNGYNDLLIAGGIDENQKHLKNCELFKP